MRRPIVSILMPSYNYENYIKEAINSVLNQTFQEWELIIIDDGSKDNSVKIIKSFKDPRIILRKQKNQGVTVTLNRALSLAKGDYICFLDSDDKYHRNKLEEQVKLINKGFDIVTTKVQAIDNESNSLDVEHFKDTWNNFNPKEIFGESKVQYFLEKNYLCKSATMLRKNLFERFGHFRTDLITAYDLELWLRMIPESKLARCEDVLTFYRWHDKNESITNNSRIKIELILIADSFICNQLNKKLTNLDIQKYSDTIYSMLRNNNLNKGFLTLQIIKKSKNINNSFQILTDETLKKQIIESFSDNKPQDFDIEKENAAQKLRHRIIPFGVRSILKKLFFEKRNN